MGMSVTLPIAGGKHHPIPLPTVHLEGPNGRKNRTDVMI